MSTPNASRQILDDAAAALKLEVVTYCDELNGRGSPPPRYFHANAQAAGDPSHIWRLKVVNSDHLDHEAIQDCNHYNNCVYQRLAKSSLLQTIVDIPAFRDVPLESLKNISCSELVEGCAPTAGDLELIVDALAQLRSRRTSVKDEFDRLQSLSPRPVNSYGQCQYRDRLVYSLRGLIDAEVFSAKAAEEVLSSFDHLLNPCLANENQTFTHGDFSFGNLMVRNDKLVYLDFEHSHIGFGELDLAHMFTNLSTQNEVVGALRLVELFEEASAQEAVVFDKRTFQALLLERTAGKMNSMSVKMGDRWERLETMLIGNARTTS